jgi:hypothetical protein
MAINCTWHGCNLPAETVDSKRCILHDPNTEKNQSKFSRALEEKLKSAEESDSQEIDLSGIVFPGDTDFRGRVFDKTAVFNDAQFSKLVDFSKAQFSKATIFNGARFGGEAYFEEAQLSEWADFSDAHFCGRTVFQNAHIYGDANFKSAHFCGDANFLAARFCKDLYFSQAQFGANVSFYHAQFSETADFNHTQFNGEANFEAGHFLGQVKFDDAEFEKLACFRGTTFRDQTYFSNVKFGGLAYFLGAQFADETFFLCDRFYDEADFRSATFRGESAFNDIEFLKSVDFSHVGFYGKETEFLRIALSSGLKFTGPCFYRQSQDFDSIARFDTLSLTNPQLVRFEGSDLTRVSFKRTDVSKVHFVDCTWPKSNGRIAVFDELALRKLQLEYKNALISEPIIISGVDDEKVAQKLSKEPPQPSESGYVSHERHLVAELYRQLRLNYESNRQEAEAGDFYIGQMEMRRQDKSYSLFYRLLLSIYRVTGMYGESYIRPLIWYAFILAPLYALGYWLLSDLSYADGLFSALTAGFLFREVPEGIEDWEKLLV